MIKIKYLYLLALFICLIGFYVYENKKMPKELKITKKNDIILPKFDKNKIPKIFHRTHKSEDSIKIFNEAEEKIKALHPDYQIINYTEEDIIEFITRYYGERILKAYLSIKDNYGAAKADFFRYLVVYAKGGVYLDIKSGPIKNITPLLEKYKDKMLISYRMNVNAFFTYFFPRGEVIQWCIISPPGHPLLKNIIEQTLSNIEYDYKSEKNFNGPFGVLTLTGPYMFTKEVLEYKGKDIAFINKNMDNYFNKYIMEYNKNNLSKKNIKDYFKQTDNIIK